MYLDLDHPLQPVVARSVTPFQVETLLEKGSGELNEDALISTGDVFGVFDGATSLDGQRFRDGMTGGRIAATTAARVFANSTSNLNGRTAEANSQIRQLQMEAHSGIQDRYKLWSTSLAVVRLLGDKIEYCQIGDSLILLLFEDGSHKMLTPEIDIDHETLQLLQTIPASQPLSTHRALAAQIRRVREQMNISYGVLNGEEQAMNFLRHGQQSLVGISDILLFTDGLFLPREVPGEEHDSAGFARLYRTGGLQAIHRHVRSIQEDDPDCRRYPRFKQHDDIAAVAISF